MKNLILPLFLSFSAFAVDQDQLAEIYFSKITPVLQTQSKSEFFVGQGGKNIHYFHYQAAKPSAALVIIPGQAESALKYAEVVYDLKDSGIDIFVLDHRGQGQSDRMLPDPIKSHVDSFSDYVDDLEKFVLEHVIPQNYPHLFALSHSMGGAILAGVLERNPLIFEKVFMSAPMFEINTKPFSETMAFKLAHTLNHFGRSNEYAPKQKPFNPNALFSESTLTSSEVRFGLHQELLRRNSNLPVGGTTSRWVETSLEWTIRIRKVPNLFQVPTIIFQAGADQWVKPGGQKQVCEGSPQYCRIQVVQNAQHEILFEKDLMRHQLLEKVQEQIKQP